MTRRESEAFFSKMGTTLRQFAGNWPDPSAFLRPTMSSRYIFISDLWRSAANEVFWTPLWNTFAGMAFCDADIQWTT